MHSRKINFIEMLSDESNGCQMIIEWLSEIKLLKLYLLLNVSRFDKIKKNEMFFKNDYVYTLKKIKQ